MPGCLDATGASEIPDTTELRAWLAELQEGERTGATLARKRSALRAFFEFAAAEKLIPNVARRTPRTTATRV